MKYSKDVEDLKRGMKRSEVIRLLDGNINTLSISKRRKNLPPI
jgi:hypothetical protein